MMALSIAQVSMLLLAILALKELYEKGIGSKTDISQNTWKYITWSFYGVGGFCLFIALLGPSFISVNAPVDAQLEASGYKSLIPAILEDRASLMRSDAFRSFAFIGIVFAGLWAWKTKKLQANWVVIGVLVLAVIDLITVDVRYFSNKDFTFKKGEVTMREKDAVDNQILQDRDLHYRVFDLSSDPFNSNEGAAFHKLIGGYDPAKLSRYQDLISNILSKDSLSEKGLDMLNCKYLIGKDQKGNRGIVPRLTANGNAWFVKKLTSAKDAYEEMEILKGIDSKTEAVFSSNFEANKTLKNATYQVDSGTTAKLISYHPDTMQYITQNSNSGYLVFSEIYYEDWQAFIDGKLVPMNKVDYTLRGIEVPEGNHKIKLVFTMPEHKWDKVELISSLTILGIMLFNILYWLWGYRQKREA